MPAYGEVFQRVEKKYRISAHQRRVVESAPQRFMEPDAYGLSRVTSVYLDTPRRSLIARSLEKPLYKEKLRVRAYGLAEGRALAEALGGGAATDCYGAMACGGVGAATRGVAALGSGAVARDGAVARCGATTRDNVMARNSAANPNDALVFVELKKKLKGVVYKRRVGMSLTAARAYLDGSPYAEACRAYPLPEERMAAESLSARSVQIAHEIDAMMERHAPLASSMAIACDRVAWRAQDRFAEQLESLRVTFDSNLRYFDCAPLRPSGGWQPVISPVESIMEVKSAGPVPLWLADALAQARVYPSPFSKYGTAYRMVKGEKIYA